MKEYLINIESLLIGGADANSKDGNDFTLLMMSVKNNDYKSIDLLIAYGAKIESKDFFGFTALDHAINQNNLKIVKHLVNHGARITDNSYMLSIKKDLKAISKFFDTLDKDKQIFLKTKV